MARFLLRRTISLIFVMFSLTFLTFVIGRLAPGDPILQLMGQQRDPATYARLTREYGLDRPLLEQYVLYATGLLRGDFGLSFHYAGRPVRELIEQGLPVSAEVGGLAMLISLFLGVPLGVAAALKQNSPLDIGVVGLTLVFYSVPTFVLIPLIWIANLGLYRAGYPSLPQAGWGTPQHLVLPVAVLAAANVGYIARLTRTSVLDVLRDDYVRTARAKGLRRRTLIGRHILRNALLPIITYIGPTTAFLVTGAFVVENLLNVPGIGRISVEAIGQRDYPVIQGTTILLGFTVVMLNLLTDVLYHIFDPRIQLSN
ncbi:MAG TPA: ABC transporter permease [Roseiflexaceae bacterium]|nr:ABC transporter permease [Roseiflexaceae bacterium]